MSNVRFMISSLMGLKDGYKKVQTNFTGDAISDGLDL
jgi:hypothetical protein